MYDPYTYGKYIMRKTYETYLSIKKTNKKDEHQAEEEEMEKDVHTHIMFL